MSPPVNPTQFNAPEDKRSTLEREFKLASEAYFEIKQQFDDQKDKIETEKKHREIAAQSNYDDELSRLNAESIKKETQFEEDKRKIEAQKKKLKETQKLEKAATKELYEKAINDEVLLALEAELKEKKKEADDANAAAQTYYEKGQYENLNENTVTEEENATTTTTIEVATSITGDIVPESRFVDYPRALQVGFAFVTHPLFADLPAAQQFHTRSATSRWDYLTSSPAYLAGGLAGVASFIPIVLTRILGESGENLIRIIIDYANLALAQADQFPAEAGFTNENCAANRHPLARYGYGLPGIIVGGLIGMLVVMPAIFLGRVLTNNLKTAKSAFVSLVNAFVAERYQLEGHTFKDSRDQRSAFWRYGVGSPGAAIMTGIALPLLVAGYWLYHTFQSAWQLTKSCLNVGYRYPKLTGVKQDDRQPVAKVVGGLGYVVAAVVAPVLAGMLAVARVMTKLLYEAGGFALFAPCAIKRAVPQKGKVPGRLDGLDNGATTTARLNALYSSLNTRGDLKVGEVPRQFNPEEKTGRVVRKAMNYNNASITERVLNQFVSFIKTNAEQHLNYDIDTIKTSVVWLLKTELLSEKTCRLFDARGVDRRIHQMKNVANFVAKYLSANQVAEMCVPRDLYTYSLPVKDAFLGMKMPAAA